MNERTLSRARTRGRRRAGHKLPSNLELFIRAARCAAGVRLAWTLRTGVEGANDLTKRRVGDSRLCEYGFLDCRVMGAQVRTAGSLIR